MVDKQELLDAIDKEIQFAKTTGMPVFVLGMLKVRQIVEDMGESK